MRLTGLPLYQRTARGAAATVIRRYSTSFGLASRLLGPGVREDVAVVYALVRVADEIVDGPAEAAGLPPERREVELDGLERRVEQALDTGFSSDVVVHAFAESARRHGITRELTRPFFASMRMDLHRSTFDAEQAERYIYGSAEVIGLMCLRIFDSGRQRTEQQRRILEDGARALGAAFQRINFLRDYRADAEHLDRQYLPEAADGLDEQARALIIASIRGQLARADAAIPVLGPESRDAVRAARELFGRLATRLEKAPLERIRQDRVRVTDAEKAAILARAVGRRLSAASRPRKPRGAAHSASAHAAPGSSAPSADPSTDGAQRNAPAGPSVVIGGGIAGLACACLLARDGHEVILLERQDRVGGRAGSWEEAGFTFDTGPSWYLMPETFDHFYAMMGTSTQEQLRLRRLDPAYRVYSPPRDEGPSRSLDLRTGDREVAELFESVEPGSAPRLRRYLRSATRAYRASLDAFLYNRFASWRDVADARVLRAIPWVLPLLPRSLWGWVGSRFADPRLRQILTYPAVFLGTSPFRAPALYHLMSHLDLRDGVRYPEGGFTAVVRSLTRLAEQHGVQIRTGCEVLSIDVDSHRGSSGRDSAGRDAAPRVRSVTYRERGAAEASEPRVQPAARVISAADEHHTETRLLAPEHRTYRSSRWRRQVSGPGAVLVLLGVRGRLPELEHHTLFFTEDWEENFSRIFGPEQAVPDPASIYVCRPSASDRVAPEGHENLFILIPVPPDPDIGGGDAGVESAARGGGAQASEQVRAAADRAIRQIAEWAGIADLEERIVLRRTLGPADFATDYHAFRGSALGPSHTLGQSAIFRGTNLSRRVRGLYYAGATTLPGVGVPMCLISAELVLKAIRGIHGPGPMRPEDLRGHDQPEHDGSARADGGTGRRP